jgi:hypothetical protein
LASELGGKAGDQSNQKAKRKIISRRREWSLCQMLLRKNRVRLGFGSFNGRVGSEGQLE